MLDRSCYIYSMKKKKHPARDINVIAKNIVDLATDENPTEEESSSSKNPHAVALGRLGGKKGGKARSEKLSPEERSEIAKKAAKARWDKK
jgi:hypothetical protein